MDINYFLSLSDMRDFCDFVISGSLNHLSSFAGRLFFISMSFSLFFCFWRSLSFDIATKDDIIQDRRQCPNSFYFGEDYDKVDLSKRALRRYMLYANLSYHTFWNVVVMGRWRLCGAPFNKIYFRVNRFKNYDLHPFHLIERFFTLYSLSFIWGYLIFLPITALRLVFCKKALC